MARKKTFKIPKPCLDIEWNIIDKNNIPQIANYAYIGSSFCQKCVFNKRTNTVKKFVLCSY